jgi:uncharacterized membrane protein
MEHDLSVTIVMPDPVDPIQPPPPPVPAPEIDAKSGTTGLPSNVAAALACFPLIGGLIFYILEKRDNFVRFYAMQSILFGAAWFLFNIVSKIIFVIFASIPALGGILVFLWAVLQALVQLAFLVVMIIAIVKAFTNVRWDIPYIGPIARKQVGDGVV